MSSPPQNSETTPLLSLLSLLTTSIHTIESELKAAQLPPFTLEPQFHPLDAPTAVPSPKLHEARKVAMGAANMVKSLVQDVGTALMDMSVQALDQSAYIITAKINLIGVFKSPEEMKSGLPVQEMVKRLDEDKKVDPEKLIRHLRLLTTVHWWTEPQPTIFAPTRWALLNTPGSPTWAWHDPVSTQSLWSVSVSPDQIIDPVSRDKLGMEFAPFVRAHKACGGKSENWWDFVMEKGDRLERFASSMEGIGYVNIASLMADYPWAALPPNSTFVDVGSGQGSVALHVLRNLYQQNPSLKAVCQDRKQHLEVGEKIFWKKELPQALEEGRVEFEEHDFFEENPRKEPNTIYWFRFIFHDWQHHHAVQILKAVRKSCHPTSRVLIADCIISEATPSEFKGLDSFAEAIEKIDNNATYQPIEAPWPLPKNFGYASRAQNHLDVLMYVLLNALERTATHFDKLASDSGFKIHKIYLTRGTAGVLELVPI